MRRVSVGAIVLLIIASCTLGVLTYASVKVSENQNAFEAAFTDLRNIFGSLQGERHPTINATRRSSKGVNFQKPAIDVSAGVGMVDGPASQEWKADAMALQAPTSLVTTHPADLPVGITEDDIYSINGATVPLHSSSNELAFAPRSDRSPLGFPGADATALASPAITASTAGPGSASGSNGNSGKCCLPCVEPAPEPGWIVLVGTAIAFSIFWWATRAIGTWLSHRLRMDS